MFAASGVTDREIWYYSNKIMFDLCTTNNCCIGQGWKNDAGHEIVE